MQTIEIILDVLYIAILVTVSYTDLRWRRIPNAVVIPGILIAFLAAIFNSQLPAALLGGFVGGIFFVVPAIIFGSERAGMGDVKLALFMGLVLGWPDVLYAIGIAALSALSVFVPLLLLRRVATKAPIPFGPFLALGALVFIVSNLIVLLATSR
jgi:prepilin signal peptidase PulO-like enzyme (type II secretory pathway)